MMNHNNEIIKSFQILFNFFHKFIAFAELHTNNNLIFIDIPELNKYFDGSFVVLTTQDLNETLDFPGKKEFDYFNKEEIKDIHYWKPKTAGELIFNYWD